MPSEVQARNRTYLLCPFCKKSHSSLPVHLRRACMKKSTNEEIRATVDMAKNEVGKLLRHGRVWEYSIIRRILDMKDPYGCLIKELQDRGNVVVNMPSNHHASTAQLPFTNQPSATEAEPIEQSDYTASVYMHQEDINQPYKNTPVRQKIQLRVLHRKHDALTQGTLSPRACFAEEKHSLAGVTREQARQTFESGTKALTDAEKSLFLDYPSYSRGAPAEEHPCFSKVENVVHVSKLLRKISDDSDEESLQARCPPEHSLAKTEKMAAYNLLVKSFPVTLDGTCPNAETRNDIAGCTYEHYCYNQWCVEQQQLRVQHVLEHFARRLPSRSKVSRWISKQGWTKNVPDAADILRQWKPSGMVDTAIDTKGIKKLCKTQKWKGLMITDAPGKGRGVFTTRKFLCGEVVCDYHGHLVTQQEGLVIYSQTEERQPGYFFFYKDMNNMAMCIDAHEDQCACHPQQTTCGRHINHSRKKANIRPRLYHVNDEQFMLFIATRDIAVNEELKFDYGANRKSFVGEELELDWL